MNRSGLMIDTTGVALAALALSLRRGEMIRDTTPPKTETFEERLRSQQWSRHNIDNYRGLGQVEPDEVTDYRYLNKNTLEEAEQEDVASSVGSGVVREVERVTISDFCSQHATHTLPPQKYSITKEETALVRELVTEPRIWEKHDQYVGSDIMLLDIGNRQNSIIILKKTELGNVVVFIDDTKFY